MKIHNPWQIFIQGILCGVLLCGIMVILIDQICSPHSPTDSSISLIQSATLVDNDLRLSQTSKININIASESALSSLPGIGTIKAKSIIDFREKYGFFEDISELTYVPGISNNLLESIQDLITISN